MYFRMVRVSCKKRKKHNFVPGLFMRKQSVYGETMKGRTRKNVYTGIITGLAASAVILYIVELLTARPLFVISYSPEFVVSIPFILMSIAAGCGIAAAICRPAFRKYGTAARVVIEGMMAVAAAVVLVIAVNLPFIPDMAGYIGSVTFWKSVAISTFINIFIMAAVGFLLQDSISSRLQKENAILQYRQLKSQVNPHFLFNSLNVLISLINKNPDLAVTYTKKLSSVYRYVLTRDGQDTVRVREETEFMDNYIDILNTRFSEGLHVSSDIQASDMDRRIPPMSLQLLIENAVKHNAVLPDRPLEIHIGSDGHCLCVSNNINPRLSRTGGTGIGLENLSRKYEILAGRDISVFQDNNVFTVKLPLL